VGKSIDTWRLLVGGALVGVLVVTLSWLQNRFDSSDHEKATRMVREYRAVPKGPTITDAIVARHPGKHDYDISWNSEIVSSCQGYVRVSGYLPPATYAFDVDLTGPSIHPTDPTTIDILRALTATAAGG
jgi:hypothetical protein